MERALELLEKSDLNTSEIAKAVTKAQNDTDSRFKPSPAY